MIRIRGSKDDVSEFCKKRYARALQSGAGRTLALSMTLEDAQIRYRPSLDVRKALRDFDDNTRRHWAANPQEVSA